MRGLDVFGGFLADGHLHLMGEIRTPFEREWIFPLGTTTLEGRELPAPANTDEFLTATYGPGWRVPDPAYKFETPGSTHRRLNGWFRGTRVQREAWDRTYSRPPDDRTGRSSRRRSRGGCDAQEGGVPATVVDIGCGRGDRRPVVRPAGRLRHRARLRAARQRAGRRARRGRGRATWSSGTMNLCELRSVLAESARVARLPGPQGASPPATSPTPPTGWVAAHLWRACEMMLRGGGRLYLEVLTAPGQGRPVRARASTCGRCRCGGWSRELEARGATVVSRRQTRAQRPSARRGTGSDGWWSNGNGEAEGRLRDVALRVRGKKAARDLGRFRAGVHAEGIEALRERVAVLEDEVQECRQLNLRLAELTDVVQELLLPVAQRDEERLAALLEKYSRGL